MKYLQSLFWGIVALMILASIANADPITIYADAKGGGYDLAAQSMAARPKASITHRQAFRHQGQNSPTAIYNWQQWCRWQKTITIPETLREISK